MNNEFDPLGLGGYRAFAQPSPQMQSRPQQSQKKKNQKDFWTDQISTGGGIGGALAGGAAGAAIGSAVPIVGTAIGGLAGAILGGALGSGGGEMAENYVTGEQDKFKNVGTEALLGGIFSAPPIRAARGVAGAIKGAGSGAAKEGFEQGFLKSSTSKLGTKMESMGTDMIATQANITRPQARMFGVTPEKTFGELNKRTGLKDMEDMHKVAENVTGAKGVYSELNRNAIGNIAGVDVSDLRKVANKLMTDKFPNRTPAQEKNITEQIKNAVISAYGGDAGSLSKLADPYAAWDLGRNFQAQARELTRGFTVNAADRQQAQVYKALGDEILGRLYSSPGFKEGLEAARPAAVKAYQQLARTASSSVERKAYEKLAQEASQLTDAKSIRSAQKAWVDLQNISDATAQAQSGAGMRVGSQMQGAGRFLQNPLNIAAVPLDAKTPQIGGVLAGAGRALQGTPGSATRGAGGVLSTTAMQGIGQNVFGNPGFKEQPATLEDALLQSTTGGDYDFNPQMGADALGEQMQIEQSPYTREALMSDIQRDPTHADKYIEHYAQLQEIFKAESSMPKLNATQQAQSNRAMNALNDISVIERAINDGSIFKTAIPGSGTSFGGNLLGTTDIEAALFNIGDVILRNRTGAAAPASEIQKFVSGFLPRGGESPEAQRNKLARAYRELMGMANPIPSQSSSLEDAILATQR